jgi:TP901 family phage tail tape measure protein/lambda family phage tail tape measure protein
MATLNFGVNVVGAEKLDKFAKSARDAGTAIGEIPGKTAEASAKLKGTSAELQSLATNAEKTAAALRAAGGGIVAFSNQLHSLSAGAGAFSSNAVELVTTLKAVARSAETSRTQLSGFITDQSRVAASIQGSTASLYEHVAALRAENVALGKMQSLDAKYVAVLAEESLLNDKGAQSLLRKTAAMEAQIAAYRQLNHAAGGNMVYNKGTDYVGQQKGAEGRAALKQGAYSAGIAAETAAMTVAPKTLKDYHAAVAATHPEVYRLSTANSLLSRSFENLLDKAGPVHSGIRGISGAMGGLWLTYGNVLPMLTTFAATAGTIKTINVGAEFDYMARSIAKLSGGATDSAEGIKLIKQSLLDISDSPFSARDLAGGMLEFARAGVKAADAIQGLDEVAKFAYLGEIKLGDAVEVVVGQLSAFSSQGLTASESVNTMAIVADQTSVSLKQVSDAFKNTTSLGTTMQLSFKDVAAALGVLGQAGIRGGTAGAALNTMMYRLISPTAAVRKQMDALGVSFSAFNKDTGTVKTIHQIGEELAHMTRNMDPAKASGLLEKMVGLRGIKALGAIVADAREGKSDFDKLTAAIEKSNAALKSGGGATYLGDYFSKVAQSGKVQIDILKASLDNLFVSSYDNSATVEALKQLNSVLTAPGTQEAVASIVAGFIKLTSLLISFATTFGSAAAFGYLGTILFGKLTAWTAASAVAAKAVADTAAAAAAAAGTSITGAGALAAAEASRAAARAAEVAAAIASWTRLIAGLAVVGGTAYLILDKIADKILEAEMKRATNSKEGIAGFNPNIVLGGDVGNAGDFTDAEAGIIRVGNAADTAREKLLKLGGAAQGTNVDISNMSGTQAEELAKFTDYLENLKDRVDNVNKTKIQVLEDQQSKELDDFIKHLGNVKLKQEEVNAFMTIGKELIERMYEGKMVKALKIELDDMLVAWKNYGNAAIDIQNAVIAKGKSGVDQRFFLEGLAIKEAAAKGEYQKKNPHSWRKKEELDTLENAKKKAEDDLRQIYPNAIQSQGDNYLAAKQIANSLLPAGIPDILSDESKKIQKAQTEAYAQAKAERFKDLDNYFAPKLEKAAKADLQLTAEEQEAKNKLAERNRSVAASNKVYRGELDKTTASLALHVAAAKKAEGSAEDWIKTSEKAVQDAEALNDRYATVGMSTSEVETYGRDKAIADATKIYETYGIQVTSANDKMAETYAALNEVKAELVKADQELAANPLLKTDEEQKKKVIALTEARDKLAKKMEEEGSVTQDLRDNYEQLGKTLNAVLADNTPKTALEDIIKGMEEVHYSSWQMSRDIEAATVSAFSGMTDAIVEFVTTGKVNFTSLADSILKDLARIAVRETITSPLAAGIKGLISGLVSSTLAPPGATTNVKDWMPDYSIDSAKGNVFRSLSLSAYSNSIVDKPTFFARGGNVMGEAGPEAILPLRRTASGNLGVESVGGSSGVVVNIIEAPGKGGQQETRQENGVNMVDVFVEQIKGSIAGDIARGSGSIPSALGNTYGLNRAVGAY